MPHLVIEYSVGGHERFDMTDPTAQPRPAISKSFVRTSGKARRENEACRDMLEKLRWKLDWYEPLLPLRRKILDLLEIQDRWFTFSDDCRPLALLG
jgi:hypothetical protein